MKSINFMMMKNKYQKLKKNKIKTKIILFLLINNYNKLVSIRYK